MSSTVFLPEPVAREVKYTVISADDHIVEPPHTFEGRLPTALQDRAPRVVETDEGQQLWEFEGRRYKEVGLNAVAGRRRDSVSSEPLRFDEMRPGCYDAAARIADMDTNGVWASVNFPSMITGFCGRVFFNAEDPDLGLACTRAWNDWLYEEWYLPYPERIVPMGVTFLSDPERAVAEIRRNAERGFRSMSFPERPHLIGLPSLWEHDHWDPIMAACVDTGTVVSLHVGSSTIPTPPPGVAVKGMGSVLFPMASMTAAVDWLFSGYPQRHPNLQIAMSEGGIGWVAMLIDRLDNCLDRSEHIAGVFAERPSDLLRRNFWFCTIDDPSTIDTRHAIGVENIMVEVDYPHGDSTWPDTQQAIEKALGHIPAAEVRAICCENAARVYRHPLPAQVLPKE